MFSAAGHTTQRGAGAEGLRPARSVVTRGTPGAALAAQRLARLFEPGVVVQQRLVVPGERRHRVPPAVRAAGGRFVGPLRPGRGRAWQDGQREVGGRGRPSAPPSDPRGSVTYACSTGGFSVVRETCPFCGIFALIFNPPGRRLDRFREAREKALRFSNKLCGRRHGSSRALPAGLSEAISRRQAARQGEIKTAPPVSRPRQCHRIPAGASSSCGRSGAAVNRSSSATPGPNDTAARVAHADRPGWLKHGLSGSGNLCRTGVMIARRPATASRSGILDTEGAAPIHQAIDAGLHAAHDRG